VPSWRGATRICFALAGATPEITASSIPEEKLRAKA
jgi:hypothetical protein